MNMITQCDIYVYMDWPEDAEPVYMGVLHSETIRGKEVFSYENCLLYTSPSPRD